MFNCSSILEGKIIMNILMTNDDGYSEITFSTPYKILSKKHNVFVSAPLSQRSCAAQSIQLATKLNYMKIQGGFAIDTTPANCVKLAVGGFFKDIKFDWILSGMNDGLNMAGDIIYSGTVAAAREGYCKNINSIAYSIERDKTDKTIAFAVNYLMDLIEKLNNNDGTHFLNINFPGNKIPFGTKLTTLGQRSFQEKITFYDHANEKYAILDSYGYTDEFILNSDVICLEKNFISITPLSYNLDCNLKALRTFNDPTISICDRQVEDYLV